MFYVSLDIETTCISPKQPDRILQIAMIAEDSDKPQVPINELPHFSAIIVPDGEINGSLTALAMNQWILVAIELFKSKSLYADFEKQYLALGISQDTLTRAYQGWHGNRFGSLEYIISEANRWLDDNFGERNHINVAGKNIAGFDMQFLPIELSKRFRHRCIDPGSVFIDWSKRALPSNDEINKKLKIKPVSHDALDDARDVIYQLRTTYPQYTP